MIKIGQVLSLMFRFNNEGLTSTVKHPYLVVNIHNDCIELAQFDSLKGKEFEAQRKRNSIVRSDGEAVIDVDSFVQLNNKFTVENFAGLERYRRQEDILSREKLNKVLSDYRNWHNKNKIDPNKIVHLTKEELERLNK